MPGTTAEQTGAPTARTSYDVVIVGGGHNGLVAAAYLARAGRSCLLLERRHQLGGAACSASPFPGVDARISRFAYLVSLLPRKIVDDLALPLKLVRRAISSYTPDPASHGARGLLIEPDDAGATAASFRALTSSERDHRAWLRNAELTSTLARTVFPTLLEPLRSREELRARVGDEDAWRLAFEEPLGHTLRRAFAHELPSGVIATDGLIGTFASVDEQAMRQNRCFLYHVIGRCTGEWLVPLGGMGALAGALERAAHEAGAELRTGAEVLALEPASDHVGVLVGDGAAETAVRAGHVLVNAAPVELARLQGGVIDGEPPEGAQLKVNMLLARLPALRDTAVSPARAFAGTLHANETLAQLELAHAAAQGGAIPDPVPCEAYCHTLTDPGVLGPSLRASGAHALTVFALHMPARLFAGEEHGGMRERALAATLRSLDSLLAEPIEDFLLRDSEGRPCVEVHTPQDLEVELRMPGGHIFHRDLSWPYAEDGAPAGSWGVETPHPRVWLCGAGARRGGGVSGIPGHNAAMAVLAAGDRGHASA